MRLPVAFAVVVLVAGGCAASAGGGDVPGAGGPAGPTGGGDTPPVEPTPGETFTEVGSRCTVGPTPHDIACEHHTDTIASRKVIWQTPLGTPPAGGWPLVVIYQGSLLSPDGQSFLAPNGMWKVTSTDGALLGIFADYVVSQLTTQTMLIKRLLDGGYGVLTPTADNAGFAWDTNLPPWLFNWPPAPDNQFLTQLFAAVEGGQLGPVSATRWYATGVSSGGYMTSRMGVSYRGRFRALAVVAGSYATCGGGLPCLVPQLPKDHPPTLFLHGAQDPLVPVSQMTPYYNALLAMGVEARVVIDPNLKHGWAAESPIAIPAWFSTH